MQMKEKKIAKSEKSSKFLNEYASNWRLVIVVEIISGMC